MAEALKALVAAGRDLTRADMLWHALWPPLASLALWSLVAVAVWSPASAWIVAALPEWSWLDWLGAWLAHIALFLVFAPLIYVTTLMLVATFALPRMMAVVAARDYPELARLGRDAFWGSVANGAWSGLTFLAGWLVTLPLLLVPGALLVLPLFWTAWLNQRTFRFDALAEHATADERRALIKAHRPALYFTGGVTALALHVPVLNLLAPAYTALAFVHLCLALLRRRRQEEGVWLE